ncbi:MAG: DUF6765 family protein [Rectinemataceae bacterium]
MNFEFHYYATTALALRAGYPAVEARRFGLSSQHVDQAKLSWLVEDCPGPGDAPYQTPKTQDYIFWDESVFRDIYLPFHFVPGDPEKARRQRIDGMTNPWIVTPDSPMAREILVLALRSGDPYRVGIALHCFADTWAHQNFSGRMEAINDLGTRSPLPAAGHFQALAAPDRASELWDDPRLFDARINNVDRFLAAARMIYRFLRTSLRKPFDDEDLVLSELADIWARTDLDDRDRAVEFTLRFDVEPWDSTAWFADAGIVASDGELGPRSYDRLRWLGTELRKRSGIGEGLTRVNTGGRFAPSEFHAWCEAAKAHRQAALSVIDARLGTDDSAGLGGNPRHDGSLPGSMPA